MNRTDRLLAIVLELQGRGAARAEDLAAVFEVSKRTVYRDIQALCEAGVPIVAQPGRGYSLVPGYFLPPLQFSTDEATMLLLGCEMMAQHFDAGYRRAAEAAARKIAGVLSAELRAAVRDLQQSIRFIAPDSAQPAVAALLQQLRGAILRRQTVIFRYHARYGQGAPDERREVDPYGLAHVSGAWYLIGYCYLRRAVRHFRVARIDGLRLLERRFSRPPGFDIRRHRPADDRPIVVRALFTPEAAPWVRETPSFFTVGEEQTATGLLVTLRVRAEREILQWLLSWGRQVQVLEPPTLRQLLADEAAAVLQQTRGE